MSHNLSIASDSILRARHVSRAIRRRMYAVVFCGGVVVSMWWWEGNKIVSVSIQLALIGLQLWLFRGMRRLEKALYRHE